MIIKTIGATILVTRDKKHYKGSGDPYFHSGPQKSRPDGDWKGLQKNLIENTCTKFI